MTIPEIDQLITADIAGDGPGCAAAVVQDGTVAHAQGYGYANLEWRMPIATDTVFRLASITKQFTATAIMLLVKAGDLALDDPLTKFLPDYPTAGHDVRVHHLLTHTSGIKSYTSMDGFFQTMSRRDLSLAELIAYFKDQPFDFAPGERLLYNNSGYVLLGQIIEQVSGLSYADFIRQHIFAPLDMNDSCYLGNEPIVPRRASGYERGKDGYQNASFLSMSLPHAAGALGSTIDNMVRWDTALREHTLLDRETLERMYTPVTLNDGTTEKYGFGWSIGTYYGHPVVHHSGGIHGFRTYMMRYPEAATTIILLGNHMDFECERLGRRISRLMLGIPAVEREVVRLDAQELRKTAGTYAGANGRCEVTWDGEQLKLVGPVGFTLIATGPNRFVAREDDDVEVQFATEEHGQYQVVTINFPFFQWTGTRASPNP